ncbi:MAG: hypothetical protein JO100_01420 [Pseudonocardia sp.]|nr:hypothetical protein [Pseudonocardia sp.]
MSRTSELDFKISMLGPTRVGKTSIVASMLQGGEQLLVGTPVTMRPDDPATERRIALTRQALQGALQAGEFRPGSLQSTNEPDHFKLLLDSGVEGTAIRFDLLDFPGEWLNPATRPSLRQRDWEDCLAFVKQSSVLIVPVDAAVLMEAARQEYRRAWPAILTTDEVRQVAGDWAAGRKAAGNEPATLLFCPVKCEFYFDDNGGRWNKSEELLNRFRDEYGHIIDRVRGEHPGIQQLYCPVDTIGCVELIDSEWIPIQDNVAGWRFEPVFGLRPDALSGRARLRPKGIDDVLAALCRQLLEVRQTAERLDAEEAQQESSRLWKNANRSEGLLRNMKLWITGERKRRKVRAAQFGREAEVMRHRVEAFDKAVEDIAKRPYGRRVRVL